MDITIIGAGSLGIKLATSLSGEDHNVTVIDTDTKKLESLVNNLDVQGICGSGTHIEDLKEANTKSSDLVIAVTHSDENNILVSLMAKKLGAKNTIARVRNPEYNTQFEFMRNELGISFMVNPDFSAALEISRILQLPDSINVESFANGFIDMAEFKISESSSLCDNSISNISSKFTNNMIICAVNRNGEVFIPNGDFVLKAKDRIYVTGAHKKLAKIAKNFVKSKKHYIKDVMIIGGSPLGIYLADMLEALGKNVIIIDKNKDKCKAIYNLVPNATVIHGDANDHDFLTEEGLGDMDAVISLTENDETNFLLSLYAQKNGVEKTITKIKDSRLNKLLDEIGLDTIINVADITVSTITQFIRAKENISSSYMRTLYKLLDGEIEAAEFLAGDYVSFIGKPLSSLKLKKNLLIAAINRKNTTIFPGGSDSIEVGDLVVVVTKDKKIKSLNDILQ
ncbi:MAG: Trk system potassium transporter TrkA [Clostridium sp.]|nr:Trk system potassium transporter TrkA [Clostridium sp.]